MAPFSAKNSTTIPKPLAYTFSTLSTEEAFKNFLSLSPATYTVDLLEVKKITLSNKWIDQVLKDAESSTSRCQLDIPETPEGEDTVEGISYKFKLVEKLEMLFGLKKQFVTIFGTQTVVEARKVHLYESLANGGLVKVMKVRVFEDATPTREAQEAGKKAAVKDAGTDEGKSEGEGQGQTIIKEQIRGDTMWILRAYTEKECRSAHKEHMARYCELVP